MPAPDDIPENVTLEWIARHLAAMRAKVSALRDSIGPLDRGGPNLPDEVRTLRDDVGVMAAILHRVDHNQTAYRDELRQLCEMHRDLRERLETIARERRTRD
jgi:uncharacterized protein (DUF3084 family)